MSSLTGVKLWLLPEVLADTFIELIVCRYGVPEELVSDNGSSFTARLLKDVSSVLQMRKLFTSVYHPQSNGQCERLNGVICTMLRTLVMNNTSRWAAYLPYILFAYRSTDHPASGTSPFEMVYGRKPLEAQLL